MTGARSVRRSTSTFKPRRRRMSERRRVDLARWLERWGLAATGPTLDPERDIGCAPGTGLVLDIGFGHGESVLDLARRTPDRIVIGIEVHTPGIATVLDTVDREGLDNVRIVHGDALVFIDRLPPTSLSEIRALFPDPWPKERQHHRRLIRPDVVAAFTDRLEIGGVLRLATDVEEYAARMIDACDAEQRLEGGLFEPAVGPADGPAGDRPLTRFERRGIDEGRRAVDLRYERIA